VESYTSALDFASEARRDSEDGLVNQRVPPGADPKKARLVPVGSDYPKCWCGHNADEVGPYGFFTEQDVRQIAHIYAERFHETMRRGGTFQGGLEMDAVLDERVWAASTTSVRPQTDASQKDAS
jgi:hypothetical protein